LVLKPRVRLLKYASKNAYWKEKARRLWVEIL